MINKINDAISYCVKWGFDADTINDSANIYASNYDEYMIIWQYLKNEKEDLA